MRHNDHDDADHEDHDLDGRGLAAEDLTWALDHVQLTTVGIDIGSATSSVMFARLTLERQSHELSSRFEVVDRTVLYRSPVALTPYIDDERIDADALRAIVNAAYKSSRLTEDEIDTGVVLLTGMALLRGNAQSIGERLAGEGGKFVCAAAGHNLEALLAAHGAGGVGRSAAESSRVVSLDVGGGTTKLTLIVDGVPVATAATLGGGRLLAWDEQRRLVRVERSVLPIAKEAGFAAAIGDLITPDQSKAVATMLAERAIAALAGTLDGRLLLAGGLPSGDRPDLVLLSGGVAQHLIADTSVAPVYDLGQDLATEISAALAAAGHRVEVATNPISATVVGAAQFSAQVSGNTVAVSRPDELPLHNLPVVGIDLRGKRTIDADRVEKATEASRTRLSLADDVAVAYAVRWSAPPVYTNLRALASGVLAAHDRHSGPGMPLVLCLDADIAANIGEMLTEELGVTGSLIVLDGLELGELDYLDVGELIMPTNVIPVLVKSLLFAGGAAHHAI